MSLDFDVIRSNRSCDEANDALQNIDLGSRQTVGNDALPLLANVEVLVAPNCVVQVDLVVELEAVLLELPSNQSVRLIFAVEDAELFIHA